MDRCNQSSCSKCDIKLTYTSVLRNSEELIYNEYTTTTLIIQLTSFKCFTDSYTARLYAQYSLVKSHTSSSWNKIRFPDILNTG